MELSINGKRVVLSYLFETILIFLKIGQAIGLCLSHPVVQANQQPAPLFKHFPVVTSQIFVCNKQSGVSS